MDELERKESERNKDTISRLEEIGKLLNVVGAEVLAVISKERDNYKAVVEEQRQGWDATLAENKRLLDRQQEHLTMIRSLSQQIPYGEEANAVPTLIAEVGTLRAQIVALKLRPPMSCLPCEEFNQKLINELEALRATTTLEGRQEQAWQAYQLGTDLDLEDIMKETEKFKKSKALFDRWWELSNNFVK